MNAKHELFILEYVKTGNATRAAIGAGYSPRSAGTQGSLLLADEGVAAEISRRQAEANNVPAGSALDRQTILNRLNESYDIGRETRNANAMATVTVKMADMVGIKPVVTDDPAVQALHMAAVEAEARKLAAEWIGDANASVNLARDAIPAQFAGAAPQFAVPTPAVFKLMHMAAKAETADSQ
jgi:phage terminase small subunit